MNRLTTALTLALLTGSVALAELTAPFDPVETGSWSQRFQEDGVGNFDHFQIKLTAGPPFVLPTAILNFSGAAGWSQSYASGDLIIADGNAIASMQFDIHFSGAKAMPFSLVFQAWEAGALKQSATGDWNGSAWTFNQSAGLGEMPGILLNGWTVDPGGAYSTIQSAIDAASAGDFIQVLAGTYPERPVVNKSLTITGAGEGLVTVDAGAAPSGTYGCSVSADNVTITDLTLQGNPANSALKYGFKPSSVSNFTLERTTATGFYRTGVDLLGVTNGSLVDVTTFANVGHGLALTDCNGVSVTDLTVGANGWEGVSVATWGRYSALGTSGIVFSGTNTFGDTFQLEMGDYNSPGVPPAGDAIITFSANLGDGADVTVQSAELGWAVHGTQDDAPGQVRVWLVPTFADGATVVSSAPIGHFTGADMYLGDLTDASTLYVTPGGTIQAAIDAASPGDVIDVSAGTYAEDIRVTQSVDLRGPNYGISPNTGSRVAEAVIVPYTNAPEGGGTTGGEVIHVNAGIDDVSIDGFTIDGDNPDLTPNGLGWGGADMHAVEGVTIYEDYVDGLEVRHNIIQNLVYFGVTIFGGGYSAPSTSGHVVDDNLIRDMGTYEPTNGYNGWGGGVLLYNDQYAAVTNNVIENVRMGIQTGNNHDPNPGPASCQVIDGNTISTRRRGIFYNLHTGNTVPLTVSNNTITAIFHPDETKWGGLLLSSLSVPGSVISGNVVDGAGAIANSAGIEVWNVSGAGSCAISGGSVSNVGAGIFLNNFEGYSSIAGDGAHATLSGTAISGCGIGIRVLDSPSDTLHHPVELAIGSGVTVSGGVTGLTVENAAASVTGLGDLALTGQSGDYVALSANAGDLDATQVSFDGLTGATATLAQNFTIEAKVVHQLDDEALGLVRVKTGELFVSAGNSIKTAVIAATSGDDVHVAPGTYVESGQIVVDKDLDLLGDVASPPVVTTTTDTGSSGDSRGWFLVPAGNELNVSNLVFDGSGHNVYQAFRQAGSGSFSGCSFREIKHPGYGGTAVAAFGGPVDFTGCDFEEIGRVGVLYFGSSVSGSTYSGCSYTGKGPGDWLDYALDISAGIVLTVNNSSATACQGVASSDGSTSAGYMVTTYFGAGTTATFTGCTMTGNTTGCTVGYDGGDGSDVTLVDCDISGNDSYGVSSTNPVVHAIGNWWGAVSGPYHPTTNPDGLGNEVTDFVEFDPWTTGPYFTAQYNLLQTPTAHHISSIGGSPSQTVVVFALNAIAAPAPEWFHYTVFVGYDDNLVPIAVTPLFSPGNDYFTSNLQNTPNGLLQISYSMLGLTAETDHTGALFSITFSGTGDDPAALTTIEDFVVRERYGNSQADILATVDYPESIWVDGTVPGVATQLKALPRHEGVYLTWTAPDPAPAYYEIYRGPRLGTYPWCPDGDILPATTRTLVGTIGGAETEATALDVTGLAVSARDVYDYHLVAVDEVENVSAESNVASATNYFLGDWADHDGVVDQPDLNLLAQFYGTAVTCSGGGMYPLGSSEADVAPTSNLTSFGLPTDHDGLVNFEDLIIFAMNFQQTLEPLNGAGAPDLLAKGAVGTDGSGLELGGSGLEFELTLDGSVFGYSAFVRSEATLVTASADGQAAFFYPVADGWRVDVAGLGDALASGTTVELTFAEETVPELVSVDARDGANGPVALAVSNAVAERPAAFELAQNFPNPFNPTTTIRFSLPEESPVRLTLFNALGQQVAVLEQGTREAGWHDVRFDAGRLASGVYVYRLEAGRNVDQKKMMLIK